MSEAESAWPASMPFTKSEYQIMAGNAVEVDEHDLELIHGKLPEALRGTFFLNGPGIWSYNGRRMHPFDGHAFIRRFTFHGGSTNRVTFCGRFVETEAYKRESKEGRIVYRGFGSLPYPASIFNIPWNAFSPAGKNTANTCVLPVDDRLLCLYEGSYPHAVNADTLRSTEIFTADGLVHGLADGALDKNFPFLAHTRWDARRQRHVGIQLKYSRDTVMEIMEFDKHMKHLSTVKHVLKGKITVIHDFVITENYYCVVLPPVSLNYLSLLKALVGMDAIIVNALSPDTKGHTLVNLIPRSCAAADAHPHEVRCEIASPFQPVHHACAHEVTSPSGATHVVLWTSGFRKGYTPGSEFGYALDSDHLDPRRQNKGQVDQLQELCSITIPLPPPGAPASDEVAIVKCEFVSATDDIALDFLEVHPDRDGLPCKFLYAAGFKKSNGAFGFNGVFKVNTETKEVERNFVGPHRLTGEPIFAPDRGQAADAEDKGWVLSMVHDGKEKCTELHVLDAQDIGAGPVAVLRLRKTLPLGFHGVWTDRVYDSASAFVAKVDAPKSALVSRL